MENSQSEGARLRFDLRLVVKHPSFDPELISKRLGLAPRMTQVAGKPRIAPNGAALPDTYKDSRWGWSTRIEGRRDFFDEVSALAKRLTPHKSLFSKIVDSGGSVEVVVHSRGDANIGCTLPWPELARLAELKIDLGIEVFPDLA